MAMNWITGSSLWTHRNTFYLWEWSSTSKSSPERLQSLHPWRCSKPVWTWSKAIHFKGQKSLLEQVDDLKIPSNFSYSVVTHFLDHSYYTKTSLHFLLIKIMWLVNPILQNLCYTGHFLQNCVFSLQLHLLHIDLLVSVIPKLCFGYMAKIPNLLKFTNTRLIWFSSNAIQALNWHCIVLWEVKMTLSLSIAVPS